VRVALDKATIHERARVSFVGIADDVLGLALGLAGELPLQAGGKARAAAPAQARLLDLLDHLIGRHLRQHPGQRLVSLARDVFVNVLRVNKATVAQQTPRLVPVEWDLVVTGHRLAGEWILVEQALDRAPLDQGLLDDLGHILQRNPTIQRIIGIDDHDRAHLAKAVTAGDDDLDLVIQPAFLNLPAQRIHDRLRSAGTAAGATAAEDVSAV